MPRKGGGVSGRPSRVTERYAAAQVAILSGATVPLPRFPNTPPEANAAKGNGSPSRCVLER